MFGIALSHLGEEYSKPVIKFLDICAHAILKMVGYIMSVSYTHLDVYKRQPLYIGFFNTGAYQESISGYGGIHHCLLPQPKHCLLYTSRCV